MKFDWNNKEEPTIKQLLSDIKWSLIGISIMLLYIGSKF